MRAREVRACFCIGPQPGQTLCPCKLRNESIRDFELRMLREEVRKLRGAPARPRTAEDDLLAMTKRLQARGGIGP